jgi:hypothetical protein
MFQHHRGTPNIQQLSTWIVIIAIITTSTWNVYLQVMVIFINFTSLIKASLHFLFSTMLKVEYLMMQLLLHYISAPIALHSSAQPWLQLAKVFYIILNNSPNRTKRPHFTNNSMYQLCKMMIQEISISFTHLLMLDNSIFSQG